MSAKSNKNSLELRRKEAIERKAAWDNLSTAEKIASLDARLGVGIGAKKQRKRLSS